MQLKDIIYRNLIGLIENLTTSGAKFDDYHDLKNVEDQDILVNLSGSIERELNQIQNSIMTNIIHNDYGDLLSELHNFGNKFPDYPDNRIDEIIILTYFINFLNESIDNYIPEQEIDILEFQLVKLEKEIHQRNFAYHDTDNLLNSLVLLDFSEPGNIAQYFSENSLAKELIIQLLPNIGKNEQNLSSHQYVLTQSELSEKKGQVWSALCLHIVRKGEIIHTPYNYEGSPVVAESRKIDQSIKYQQFNDSIQILSEYNNQHDILDKYLRMYHLVENFMYKLPLVNLERKHAGEVFSMRDFQRMYDLISSNELQSLKKLFKHICDEDYQAGMKFSDFLFSSWQSLVPGEIADQAMIDQLLSYLRIENTFASVDLNQISTFFAKLVYSFRNSLVHNRETEFHLTHDSLLNHRRIGNTAQIILEKFLIPSLEEVVYYLIIEENDLIWFENSFIKLYNDN